MMKKLEILFEKYKFDYIFINSKDIINLEWANVAEEDYADFNSPHGYLGKIYINDNIIEIYHDKQVAPGDVIFKYKNIKKERCAKLKNLTNQI